jgi:hypothetical protein
MNYSMGLNIVSARPETTVFFEKCPVLTNVPQATTLRLMNGHKSTEAVTLGPITLDLCHRLPLHNPKAYRYLALRANHCASWSRAVPNASGYS